MNKLKDLYIDSVIIEDRLYQYATKKDRWIAGLIDRTLIILFTLILNIIFFFITFNIVYQDDFTLFSFFVMLILILINLISFMIFHFLIYYIYYSLSEKRGKQTIGKKIKKIEMFYIEENKKAHTTSKHIFIRYFMDLVLIYYFTPEKYNQYMHDKKSKIIALKKID